MILRSTAFVTTQLEHFVVSGSVLAVDTPFTIERILNSVLLSNDLPRLSSTCSKISFLFDVSEACAVPSTGFCWFESDEHISVEREMIQKIASLKNRWFIKIAHNVQGFLLC